MKLLAVPNTSEGRDPAAIVALAGAFAGSEVELLDRHSDPVHHRSVYTLAGEPPGLEEGLLAGAREALELIDLRDHDGAHPRVGALDVCPVVFWEEAGRRPAEQLARRLAEGIAELGIPVLLYGNLASSPERRRRAFFRRGGPAELRRRMAAGELRADLGPTEPHPRAGATLITARRPLAAFNVELAGVDLAAGKLVAARVRESGGGPPGVRAIALDLGAGRIQVSTNVNDPVAVPLGEVVAAVEAHACPLGGAPVAAELIGLVPAAALAAYPPEVPIRDFDPGRHTIEARLAG